MSVSARRLLLPGLVATPSPRASRRRSPASGVRSGRRGRSPRRDGDFVGVHARGPAEFVRGELHEGDWITVMAPQQGIWWTARQGLSVPARSRYYVENPEKLAMRREENGRKDEALGHTPEERAAMVSLADATGLPLRVTTMQFDSTRRGDQVVRAGEPTRIRPEAWRARPSPSPWSPDLRT